MQNDGQQQPRLWLGAKFGHALISIDRQFIVEEYTQFLRDELDKRGLLLETTSHSPVVMTKDCTKLWHRVEDMILVSKQRPVLLLIDDYQKKDTKPPPNYIKTFIEKFFKTKVYILLTNGFELDEMRVAGNYDEAKSWCEQFLEHCVKPTEGLSFGLKEEPVRQDQPQESPEVNEPPNDHPMNPSIDPRVTLDSEESETYGTPPGTVNENDFLHKDDIIRQQPPEPVPQEEPAVTFVAVVDAIKMFERNANSHANSHANFASTIAGAYLFRRFENPFLLAVENFRLLELVNIAIRNPPSPSERDAAVQILMAIVDAQYLEFCCDLTERVNNYKDCLSLLRVVMHVFLSTLNLFGNDERIVFRKAWEKFVDLLQRCPQNVWNVEEHSRGWFLDSVDMIHGLKRPDRVDKFIEQRQKRQMPVQKEEPPPPQSQPRPPDPSDMLPFWQTSEGKEPPGDFRLLSEHPVYSDVVNPVRPYLRRAIVNGTYINAEHYLDVQFRLFREDLISPIRDGLTSHRQNGTSRYTRRALEDRSVASDIIIFEVDALCGLQTRSNTGENMHYVKLTNMTFVYSAASRHLKFGQVVILSSDGFESDVHIALIAERNDSELMFNGLLGLMFYDERGLETGKRYIMAEPSNYLEGYIHVLRVFKNTDRFHPLPFERYLVHCKKDVRLPAYLRSEDDKTEEEKEEERAAIKVYNKLRGNFFKNTSAREYTDSGEEDYDIGLFVSKAKNKRYHSIADESAKQYLYVKGRKYKLSSFEEDYQPDDLDDSQRKAMVAALTSELALIQGPPGTGKTFIGVEIVSTILENQGRLGNTGPILLVCYTNVALDQFLEKIIDRIDSDRACGLYQHNGPVAVRLGTKSASTKLERARIMRKEVVTDYGREVAPNEDGKLGQAYNAKRRTQLILGTASYIISEDMSKNIMSYETISQILPMRYRNEFGLFGRANVDSHGHLLHPDEVLACWLLDKSMEGATNRGLPPMEEDDSEEFAKKARMALRGDEEQCENLEDILKELDLEAKLYTESSKTEGREFSDDLYETRRPWDIVTDGSHNIPRAVKIFGPGTKETFGKGVAPFDAIIANELYDVKDTILRAKPLGDAEVSDIRSVYGLPKQRRWDLFAYWCQKVRTMIRDTIPGEMAKYKRDCDRVAEARQQLDVGVFKRSLIIGATTTGAAKCRKTLEQVGCTVLVVEEAAEVLEAHTFASFIPSLEHAIFIGDHQQLRPNPAVYELARTYRMDVSLFERLINNGAPFNTLAKQHRMNTEITKHVVRPHFYNNLEDSDNVKEYPDVAGMAKNLFFWSHNCPEATGYDGVSYSNEAEVGMTISLVDYLLKQHTYSQDDITIIATYSAQVEKLRRAIANTFGTKADTELPAVAVETVDSYQGRENKIIIVSLVRCGGPTIGFLSVANRICVALTRAQHGMYVVGSMHHLSYSSHFWNEIVGTTDRADLIGTTLPIKCQDHGRLQLVEDPDDFKRKAPDGGCTEICGTDLACHHTCPRRCHPEDDHNTYQCKLDCMKACKKAGHPCQKRCYEFCENDLCSVIVNVSLPCSHEVNVACHKSSTPKCESRCENTLPCMHRCNELCGTACTTTCKENVVLAFPCRHEIVVPCCDTRSGLKCKARCSEELPCGHQCQEQCGDYCTFTCMEKVDRHLPCGHNQLIPCSAEINKHQCEFPVKQTLSCNHTVDVPCYAGNDRSKCTMPCRLSLPCGHVCGRKCGECYHTGSHKCFDMCGVYKKCGHACTRQCGDKCDDNNCGANCFSCCSHISCGPAKAIGQLAFMRACKEQCVTCLKPCENFCEHRSCNRRCYDVCDVKPCEEGCKKLLKCNHACLGLCGEVCPDICGSCYKTAYKDLLAKHLPDAGVFERLIKIRGCGHMFPVRYMDDVVKKHKEKGELPRCPSCRSPIHSNHRYLRIIKKYMLDTYKAKETVRNALVKKDLGQMSRSALDQLTSFSARRETKRLQKILQTWSAIFNKLTAASKANEKETKAFWADVLSLGNALNIVFLEYIDGPGIPKRIADLPRFGEFVDGLLPRGQVQTAINDQLEEACAFFINCLDSRMSGALVPTMRHMIAKAWFFLTIGKLWLEIKKKHGADLDVYQMKDLRTMGLHFLNATLDKDSVAIYGRFVACVNEKVLKPLALPPFNGDLVFPTL